MVQVRVTRVDAPKDRGADEVFGLHHLLDLGRPTGRDRPGTTTAPSISPISQPPGATAPSCRWAWSRAPRLADGGGPSNLPL
jgi:hypothetical protein